ncbi:HAD family hydrolase [Cellulomonas sp. P24]|uniref:HAD family hydrolase n=1 Tax=Cellulomonas sp. P24 TaxID=2885206 RepID=UPI0028709E66|nr:HAD family hydrolase [Cellulomonas sp. P24]MCR6494002.1 HAD family hydrolase [Cellulomonas sp. P24]
MPPDLRQPAPVDGVLFDIDDTLVDTRSAFRGALAAVAEVYLPDLPESGADRLLTVWRADVNGHYRAYTRGDLGYQEQRQARANELHREFGGPVLDDAAYAGWSVVFERGFEDAWAAHEDALAAVMALLAAGLRVGALSNASVAYQRLKLERVGLHDHVPMLVGVDTLGFGKPDERVFLEACRRLGTDPGRTAYVGDELDIDARAALAAGLRGDLARPAGLSSWRAARGGRRGRACGGGAGDRLARRAAGAPGALGPAR